MLRTMRKKMRAILIATIIIIIPAFIGFYGLGRYRGRKSSSRIIAKVNGQKISHQQFYMAYRKARESQQAVQRGPWGEEMKKQTGEKALGELIREALFQQEAKRRRIKVSDEEVLEEIKIYPYFQKEGQFDRNLYLQILETNRIDPHKFEEGVRNDLRTRKLIHQVAGGVYISDEELREEYIKRNERVRVRYLLFKGEDFKKGMTAGEKEIEDYFQTHREELKIPDRINAEYIMVSPRPEEVEVEEEEITNYYQEHLDQYRKEDEEKPEEGSLNEASLIPPEEVRAEIRAAVANQKADEKAREEAESLAVELFDKTVWEAGVKERNLEVKETNFFARGEAIKDIGWAPDFIKEAFALEEDEVSEAVRTPKGYAILVIKERSKAHLPKFEEVKDKVEEKVRDKNAKELARAKAEECLRSLNEGNDFEETAKAFSLKVKDSEFFSHGEYIKGVGFSFPFAEAAFSLREGGISPMVKVNQGFAILKMEAKKEIDEEKYASDAEEFRKNLLPRKQTEAYNKWYQTLREEADIWIDPDFKEELERTTEG